MNGEPSPAPDNPEALFETGKKFYFSARDSAADPALALAYFEKAALLGFAPAQRLLGISFLEGLVVPKDPLKARQWLEPAAQKGDVQAAYSLALIYAQGLGTPKNWSQAYHLLNRPGLESLPEARTLKIRLKEELISLYPNLAEALRSTEKVHRCELSLRQQRFILPFLTPGRLELDEDEFEIWLSLNLGRTSQENTLMALQKCLTLYYAQMKAAAQA
ncbi:MAG: sel1 repeat family protein [Deltaproteobacteria bacterium]|jgi:hypothetical protein|nr:sel1 repeat family protein [Deltaproteobacteria bacterium]